MTTDREKQELNQGAPAARTATTTPGPWTQSRWGNHSCEIQGGGHSVAIVGRVQAKRLDYLNGIRSKAAKNGEAAHQAETEAQKLEAYDPLPDAKLIAAAPALADALERMTYSLEFVMPGHTAIAQAQAALKAAGRLP